MALFCLALSLSTTSLADSSSDEEFSLDFEARGPEGLKKCTLLMAKQQKALAKCKKSAAVAAKKNLVLLTVDNVELELRGKNSGAAKLPKKCMVFRQRIKSLKAKCGL